VRGCKLLQRETDGFGEALAFDDLTSDRFCML
jgi:hypothetical protein